MKNARVKDQPRALRVNMGRVFRCDAKTLFGAISGGALFDLAGAKKSTLRAQFKKGGKIHCERESCSPVDGEFLEITPPERIVFSWNYFSDAAKRQMNTVVTVTIREQAGKSTLTLVHDGFADFAQVEDHNGVWNQTFDRLRAALRQLVAKLEGNKTGLDLYFRHRQTVAAPVDKVFHAVVTANELVQYFNLRMTGKFREGTAVKWKFEGMDPAVLDVHRFVPNELLKFRWGKSHVCFSFREIENDMTEVTIESSGWDPTQAGLDDSYSHCEGWKEFLLSLKAHVEAPKRAKRRLAA